MIIIVWDVEFFFFKIQIVLSTNFFDHQGIS